MAVNSVVFMAVFVAPALPHPVMDDGIVPADCPFTFGRNEKRKRILWIVNVEPMIFFGMMVVWKGF